MPELEFPKANPENLLELIKDCYEGKLVIPQFQRSFVWTKDQVEELLRSILRGYFIGTFLILDTSSEEPVFPYRLIEGVDKVNKQANGKKHSTIRLVLDGQQRITSLFYALYEPEIPLKGASNPYRFYLLLEPLIRGDFDSSIVGVSFADRRRMSEYDRLVNDSKAIHFTLMRDHSSFYKWLYTEQKFLDGEAREHVDAIFSTLQKFMVPVISLSPSVGVENIVNIFEKINSTGTPLSLFDLAVAQLYPKITNLRDLWDDFLKRNKRFKSILQNDFPIKIIALLDGKETRRGALLEVIKGLTKERFYNLWDKALSSLEKACDRLTAVQGGYGALAQRWVPYKTLLVPLAALLSTIEELRGGADMYQKLDIWYWGSVLTARYESAVDSTTYKDFKEVRLWFENKLRPAWLPNALVDFKNIDLKEVKEHRSAIYRGLMCLVILKGARDFINGQPVNLMECQDDHIFPKAVFNHPSVDSILNRTLISKKSNEIKGKKKPSVYLPLLLKSHGGDEHKLLRTLETHLISKKAYEAMQNDDLESFLEERKKSFLKETENRLSS